jgi:hypothetical protein
LARSYAYNTFHYYLLVLLVIHEMMMIIEYNITFLLLIDLSPFFQMSQRTSYARLAAIREQWKSQLSRVQDYLNDARSCGFSEATIAALEGEVTLLQHKLRRKRKHSALENVHSEPQPVEPPPALSPQPGPSRDAYESMV